MQENLKIIDEGHKSSNFNEKARYYIIFFILLLINIGLSFAQNNTIDGVWYFVSNYSGINIRVFKDNQAADFYFELSDTYNVKPMSLKSKNYKIESTSRINIDGKTYVYYTSPQIFIIEESRGWGSITTNYYHPVLEIKSESLIGNWIITGEEYDIEVEITANSLTFKKGKIQRNFAFSSPGFPVIALKDSSGTNFTRNYFFFGKDIVALNIPGESGAQLFQRKN